MKKSLYLIFAVSLFSLILISLVMWIYSKDLFFFSIAILLIVALILIVLELRKLNNDPFF